MKFVLEETMRGASDEELLNELRRCADAIGRKTITIAEFENIAKVHPCTIQRRFGSWSNALKRANLDPSRSKFGISEDELFDNIKSLWIALGRQPKYNEIKAPLSLYSAGTYENRYGSWTKALQRFVSWVNSGSIDNQNVSANGASTEEASVSVAGFSKPIRRTKREISDRQRFRILVRDGFRCKSCGASPLLQTGIELHVDHILPWSNGGETIDDNLETKCKQCNLGKGNAFNV